jgi:hypothetical protein
LDIEPKAPHFEFQKAIALGVLKAIGFCNGALAYDFGLFGVVTPFKGSATSAE